MQSRDLRNWRSVARSHWGLRLLGFSRLAFLPIISAAVLFAWQGFIAKVQYFDVVSTTSHTEAPIGATIVRFVRHALGLPPPTTYDMEQQMSASELLDRWNPLIEAAAKRFAVPVSWVRTVMQMESGGRTMSGEKQPIVSRAGAMGLMQLMPGTYQEMRAELGLGANAFDPHDNIFAGVAYLRWLHGRYGYPAMFAAYNDGPGNFEARVAHGQKLPTETRNYVTRIAATLGGGGIRVGGGGTGTARLVKFTRPNGSVVTINMNAIVSVRAALPGEYAPGVHTVITVDHEMQGVRESLATVSADLHAHGAITHTVTRTAANDSQHLRRVAALSHKGRLSASYAM